MKKQTRITRRSRFLSAMDAIIPWEDWKKIIQPYYPAAKTGRPRTNLETMLRMYLLQVWFSLSDEGLEDGIYESVSFQEFLHLDKSKPDVPDATTLLHFRHLMEKHNLGERLFNDLSQKMLDAGLMMKGGSIIDATIFSAPGSTKNKDGKRDPEMSYTVKRGQYHFGAKAHTGVDALTGYVHSLEVTPANVADIKEAANLIRKDDEVVYADAGYTGIEKRKDIQSDPDLADIDYRISRKPSSLNTTPVFTGINYERRIEGRKASVRSKVEHVYHVIKDLFGFRKLPYHGIAKNKDRIYTLCMSANLYMIANAGRCLMPSGV